jgi:hypothetical protein
MDNQRTDREGGGNTTEPKRGQWMRLLYALVGMLLILYAVCALEAVRVLRIWQTVVLVAVCGIAGISLLAIGIFAKPDRFVTGK